eukprot:1959669-Pleurochrysis_carterae.AAC.1
MALSDPTVLQVTCPGEGQYMAYYWGGSAVDGSLCREIPYSVSTPSSVLSYLNFSERTHSEHFFDSPIQYPYWVEEVIWPYDYDSFLNASFTLPSRISPSKRNMSCNTTCYKRDT